MEIEELKRATDQRPFQPFGIRTADGRSITVGHPNAVAWDSQSPRIVRLYHRGRRMGSD
jgi:hypothetical protein